MTTDSFLSRTRLGRFTSVQREDEAERRARLLSLNFQAL